MPKSIDELAKVGYETFHPSSTWETAQEPVKESWRRAVNGIINRTIPGNLGEFAYTAFMNDTGDWYKLTNDQKIKWGTTARAIYKEYIG